MRNKMLGILLLCSILIISLIGWSTPKLKNKTEKADSYKMENGKWDAKFAYLEYGVVEFITSNYTYNNDQYVDKQTMFVNENNNLDTGFFIKVIDSNGNIKSKMGTEISSGDEIKIVNSEVEAKSLDKFPESGLLLVREADIELIKENKFEDILKSNKKYNEIPDIYQYMDDLKNGKINSDKKYSQKVEELLISYEEDKKNRNIQNQEEVSKQDNTSLENIPLVVTTNYKAKFGEVKEANALGKSLTIKFKIEPSYNNEATINQNSFNVEDLILNQKGDQYETINYWAVADMEDGSEGKVISFTLDKGLIEAVKNRNLIGKKIVERANDVWILPSLKE